METIEILKKTYDDLEKKHGEDEDGLRVESIGPLLGVVGIRHQIILIIVGERLNK